MRIAVAAGTDIGRLRTVNQDAVHAATFRSGDDASQTRACLVVADGLGGHAAGEVASGIAVRTIAEAAERPLTADHVELANPEIQATMRAAVEEAHDRIVAQSSLNADLAGMGTVVVAAWIVATVDRADVLLAHAGDSRAYALDGDGLRQLTADHSWVGEAVRAGRMTPEETRTDTRRNVVTRSLGAQETVDVELTGPVELSAAQRLLLCSDGLHGVVAESAIATLLGAADLDAAVGALIDAANEAGGPDNIGVSIAAVE